MVTFSFHAKQKMEERGIREEEILSVIKKGKIANRKSNNPNAKVLYDNGIFVVISNKKVIVTVYTLIQTRNVINLSL